MTTIQVETSEGPVQGHVQEGVAAFWAIPYAAPPVGLLRFEPPQPPAAHSAILNPNHPAAIPPQIPSRLEAIMGKLQGDMQEDCLTLQIWVPHGEPTGPFPVMIWFHGGGYISGSGSLPWYDGSSFARENNCICVNVNYRLGVLGYLYYPGLSVGNLGLRDQIAAIDWVRRNIAQFDGDPTSITLAGASAGAHSIACLLADSATRDLVRRAILISTPFGMGTISQGDAIATGRNLLRSLEVDPTMPDLRALMQQIPVDRLLEAQLVVMRDPARGLGNPTPPFGPVALGGIPAGKRWEEAVQEGACGIDAIIGTTANEMAAFYLPDPNLANIEDAALDDTARILFGDESALRIARVRQSRPHGNATQLIIDAQTERYFRDGSERLAEAVSGSGGRAWLYRFDWAPPKSRYGACHSLEIPFLFDTYDAFSNAQMLGTPDRHDRRFGQQLRQAFGHFVTSGDPNGPELPHWKAGGANNVKVLDRQEGR